MSEFEELAARVARIMGESSAAAKALNELERRRTDGQEVWIAFNGDTWFVYGAPVDG